MFMKIKLRFGAGVCGRRATLLELKAFLLAQKIEEDVKGKLDVSPVRGLVPFVSVFFSVLRNHHGSHHVVFFVL